jgi:hypothetical protein
MARNGLFTCALLFVAALTLAFAHPAVAQDAPPDSLNFEGVMNTADSLAWSLSDSSDEVVVVEVPVGGFMGWFERDMPWLARSGAGQLFIKGGNFMLPLFLCAIVMIAVLIERFVTLARARTNTRRLIGTVITTLRSDGITEAAQVCERTRGPIAAILHSGLLRADRGPEAVEKAIETSGTIEMSFLERGLVALSTVANVAPLLGRLGYDQCLRGHRQRRSGEREAGRERNFGSSHYHRDRARYRDSGQHWLQLLSLGDRSLYH